VADDGCGSRRILWLNGGEISGEGGMGEERKRRGELVAVLFSESPRYPEHNARYPGMPVPGYIVSVLRPRMEM